MSRVKLEQNPLGGWESHFVHEFIIPFIPSTITRLFQMHWRQRGRIKGKEIGVIVYCVQLAGIPRAEGKRRVSQRITLTKGQRRRDADNSWKVLLDGLVKAGALIDDKPRWVETTEPEYERGETPQTIVTLEDLY